MLVFLILRGKRLFHISPETISASSLSKNLYKDYILFCSLAFRCTMEHIEDQPQLM